MLIFLFPYLCWATALNVSPVRVEIPAGQNNAAFTISNPSDESVLLQLKAVAWDQKAGEDIFTETKDIIINPPIINLTADNYQLFRVGLRTPLPSHKEHTYRIFATQVATPLPPSKATAVRTLIEFSIPIFVAPQEEKKDLQIELKSLKKDESQLLIVNDSNMHIHISQISLYQNASEAPLLSQDTFVYLLPKQEKTWVLPWNQPKDMDDLTLKLQTDWGEIFETIRTP